MTDQGLATLIHTDKRKQAMLNFVPFAGAGREMSYMDRNVDLISQLLEFQLP